MVNKAQLTLFETTVAVVVDFVVFGVNIVVVVVAIFVVTDPIIFSCGQNCNLRLLKATVEFLWW